MKDIVFTSAVRTGFGSATLFGRIFKRVTGATPLEYRKRSISEVSFSPSIHRAEGRL